MEITKKGEITVVPDNFNSKTPEVNVLVQFCTEYHLSVVRYFLQVTNKVNRIDIKKFKDPEGRAISIRNFETRLQNKVKQERCGKQME